MSWSGLRLLFVSINPGGASLFPGIKLLADGTESVSSVGVAGNSLHPKMVDNGNLSPIYANAGTFTNYFEFQQTNDLANVGGVLGDSSMDGGGAMASDYTYFYWVSAHHVLNVAPYTMAWKIWRFSVPAGGTVTSWDITSIIPEATDTTPDGARPKMFWNFPSSFAMDPGGDIAYLGITTGSALTKPTSVRKIVLSTLTASTFYTVDPADVELCQTDALQTLRDGTLLVATKGTIGAFNSRVVRLTTAGIVSVEYPLSGNSSNNVVLMQVARDDASIWLGTYDPVMANGYDYQEWNAASGALIRTLTTDLNSWPNAGGQDIDPDTGYAVDYVYSAGPTLPSGGICQLTSAAVTGAAGCVEQIAPTLT